MAFTADLIDKLSFMDAKDIELAVAVWASTSKTVKVTGITRRGYINVTYKHVAGDRSVESVRQGLTDFPIFVRAGITGNSPPGRVYAQVMVRMGGATLYPLITGYLFSGLNLSWPVGRNAEAFLDGPGYPHSLLGTDPAANVEISETVPTNAYWDLESIRCTLVCDANVADRTVNLIIDDGANVLYTLPAGAVITANETKTCIWVKDWARAEAAFDAADEIRTPLPHDLLLPQAYRVRTSTTNLQATDNFAAPRLKLREWLHE